MKKTCTVKRHRITLQSRGQTFQSCYATHVTTTTFREKCILNCKLVLLTDHLKIEMNHS